MQKETMLEDEEFYESKVTSFPNKVSFHLGQSKKKVRNDAKVDSTKQTVAKHTSKKLKKAYENKSASREPVNAKCEVTHDNGLTYYTVTPYANEEIPMVDDSLEPLREYLSSTASDIETMKDFKKLCKVYDEAVIK